MTKTTTAHSIVVVVVAFVIITCNYFLLETVLILLFLRFYYYCVTELTHAQITELQTKGTLPVLTFTVAVNEVQITRGWSLVLSVRHRRLFIARCCCFVWLLLFVCLLHK